MTEEYLLKICVVGLSQDYRTFFVRSFAEGKFDDRYLPVLGVDITTKKILLDGLPVKLIMVDAAGQEFFGKLRPSYYQGASGAVITFNKAVRQSFIDVPKWLAELRKYTGSNQPITASEKNIHIIPKQIVKEFNIPIALVGITVKPSMHREPEIVVSFDEGQALADELGLKYFDCDLTTQNSDVEEIIHYLTRKIIEKFV